MVTLRRLALGLLVLVLLGVGAIVAAGFLADVDGLIAEYKPQALAAASEALNRELEVEQVSATWFPTLGLRAEGVRIGDQPLTPEAGGSASADDAFVELDALQVGVAVWPALVSLGRKIEVSQIRLEGPSVRIVRFKDGTFNFSSLGPPADGAPEPEPEPKAAEEGGGFAERLTSASVGAVAITDGVLYFEDRSEGGLGTLEVTDLGLLTQRVGLGLPVEAEFQAALAGAESPNLRLELSTGPLASRVSELGPPELRQLVFHAESVPLSIVPVAAQPVVLDAAGLSADVRVTPGSDDQLVISGPLNVEGLRLAQEGGPPGAPFDVELALSVATSTSFREVVIQDTRVSVGPLRTGLSGTLRTAPELSWNGFKVVSLGPFSVRDLAALAPGDRIPVPGGRLSLNLQSSGGPSRLSADVDAKWTGLDYIQEGLSATGGLGLSVRARGAPATPSVEVKLDLSQVGVQAEGFQKPAGLATRLDVNLDVQPSRIELQPSKVVLGAATLVGRGHYPMNEDGKIDFTFGLDEVKLKPWLGQMGIAVETLPAGSSLGLNLRYQAPAAEPARGSLTVPKLSFQAGQSRLTADASVERFEPLRARVRGRSPYLNLDELMPQAAAEEGAEAPPPEQEDGPLLPPSMRAAEATIDLEVQRLIYSGVEMAKVDVLLLLRNGRLEVKSTKFGVFGGRFAADGTSLDLTANPLKYDLVARLDGLRGEAVLAKIADVGETLTGRLNSQINLSGQGFDLASLSRTLSGAFSVALDKGRLNGVNLVSSTVLPLQEALSFADTSGRLRLGEQLVTEFRRLAGSFEVEKGGMRLSKPLTIQTSQGKIDLRGGMGMDGNLAFTGAIQLPPTLVNRLAGGKVRAKSALPVEFGIGCTLSKPCVQNVDVKPAAQALTQMFAGKAVDLAGRALQKKTGIDPTKAQRAAKAALRDAEAAKKKAEAEARQKAEQAAREARAKAEQEARQRAEEAKKKAEEEAKKKLKSLFGR